jgi:hypothetical protein
VVPARKPVHVADVADHGGDDRADPEQAGQAGPGRGDGDSELLPGLPDPGIDAAQVLQERRGELPAGRLHRPFRPDRLQHPGGASCGDHLGHTTGDQLAQHRMQPADDLGAGAAQVTVPFGPDLQHRRVIIGPHPPDTGRPQRRDRHRPGIVRVVLVHVPGGQQPDPRAEFGLHIATRLPADTSCWASRWPVPPAPSTAQVRCGHAAAQANSRSAWTTQARTRSSPSGSSAALIATAVCEALCGSTPIITAAIGILPFPSMRAKTVAGTPDSRDPMALAPLLSHATAKPRPAGTSFGSQTPQGGRRFESQANRDLSTLRP